LWKACGEIGLMGKNGEQGLALADDL